jgi:hypothetical protein
LGAVGEFKSNEVNNVQEFMESPQS